jgi:hypothetical protein
MYHFETVAEVTLGKPQSGRSGRFDAGAYRNQSPFVVTYVGSHNWLSLVEPAFFEDAFNTYGIPLAAADYQLALQVIRGDQLDGAPPDARRLAETAYGYLHARYICTANGLRAMRRKFEAGVFGHCPRFRCDCQQLLLSASRPKLAAGRRRSSARAAATSTARTRTSTAPRSGRRSPTSSCR